MKRTMRARSFATPDQLGTSKYGSEHMHVPGTGRSTMASRRSGYDDEGVEAQTWDIVRDGVLVGYQLDRAMGVMLPELNRGGPTGAPMPIPRPYPDPADGQRFASAGSPRAPRPKNSSLELIAGSTSCGDKSWSIDMQRFNFQFTGQRFFAIKNGHLSDNCATWRTRRRLPTSGDRWRLSAARYLGSRRRLQLRQGSARSGRAVSHGCPSALFGMSASSTL